MKILQNSLVNSCQPFFSRKHYSHSMDNNAPPSSNNNNNNAPPNFDFRLTVISITDDGPRTIRAFLPPQFFPMFIHHLLPRNPLASPSGDHFESLLDHLFRNSQHRGTPPTKQSIIERLPVERITSKHISDSVECSVCKEAFTEGEPDVVRLPCNALHLFHMPCIKPWLEQHNTCPVCRYELPVEDPEYERERKRRMASRNVQEFEEKLIAEADAPSTNSTPRDGTKEKPIELDADDEEQPQTKRRRTNNNQEDDNNNNNNNTSISNNNNNNTTSNSRNTSTSNNNNTTESSSSSSSSSSTSTFIDLINNNEEDTPRDSPSFLHPMADPFRLSTSFFTFPLLFPFSQDHNDENNHSSNRNDNNNNNNNSNNTTNSENAFTPNSTIPSSPPLSLHPIPSSFLSSNNNNNNDPLLCQLTCGCTLHTRSLDNHFGIEPDIDGTRSQQRFYKSCGYSFQCPECDKETQVFA